ncbi:MAG: hypothetical protein OEL88_15040 [Sterolibacteriaceae bacterium MAG5]|nr:hypothetical protein [Candidatus Nitricoxidireducens bremensis]
MRTSLYPAYRHTSRTRVSRVSSSDLSIIAVTIFLIAVVLYSFFGADKDQMTTAAESMGYTNVSSTGHAWFACGKGNNLFSERFSAVSATGKSVNLVACKGVFKDTTIRID